MMFGVLLLTACNPDVPYAPTSTDPVARGGATPGINTDTMLDGFTRAGDRSGGGMESQSCVGSSVLVPPDTTKNIMAFTSQITLLTGSVSAPTTISFNICNQDTVGTTLRPKAMVFGPNLNFTLARDANVHANLVDIGLVPGASGNQNYKIYRYDANTRQWSLHASPSIGVDRVNFKIRTLGRYALATTLPVVPDSFWSVSGVVTPAGGVLNLLNSNIAFAPEALEQSTQISFSMRIQAPVGLPGALPRIYEFGPEGTTFKYPAILSVSFQDAGLTMPTEAMMYFYYHDEVNNQWIRQETQMDVANRRFVVRLEHFSRYAFGR